jgi:uncharacterized phage protein (TIGR01671 family)
MRDIKFRAWDKDRKAMVYEFSDKLNGKAYKLFYEDGKLFCGNYLENGDWNQPELMQYTGLKDKSGKEIYEGDIIDFDGKMTLVSWSEKFASFCIKNDTWMFQHWFGEAVNPSDCEVIGNIYEHPELLSRQL